MRKLDDLCRKLHTKRKFYQDSDLNLLCYGVGSKRDFLNIYVHEFIRMQHQSCIVINGFHSGTNLKVVFKELIGYILRTVNYGNKKGPQSLQDQYDFILRAFEVEKSVLPVYLVIHSLDMG